MFDLGRQTIEISCPSCRRRTRVSLAQVGRQETVQCICGTSIKLVDKGRATARGIREISRSFKNLERQLKKIGNLKIKF